MPAVDRELKITYGTREVGGSTEFLIDQYTQHRVGSDTGSMSFDVVVAEDTLADFQTACEDLERDFRIPYLDLTVEIDGVVFLQLWTSDNSALDTKPNIEKVGGPFDTARSRKYRVSFEFGMPADNVSPSGLRDNGATLSFDDSRRRTATVRGSYSSVGLLNAREAYNASADALSAAILASFGGVYNLVREDTSENRNITALDFERVYEEILRSEGGVGLDDPDIASQVLSITPRRSAPGDSFPPDAVRLTVIDVNYSAAINAARTKDLIGKWEQIRWWVIDTAIASTGGGSAALVEEAPSFNEDQNRISAHLVIEIATDGGLLSNRITVEDHDETGERLVPAWTGDPLSRYVFQGPRTVRRTITQVFTVVGAHSSMEVANIGGGGASRYGGPAFNATGSWSIVSETAGSTVLIKGMDGQQFEVTESRHVRVMELYTDVSRGTGGGGYTLPADPGPGYQNDLQKENTP